MRSINITASCDDNWKLKEYLTLRSWKGPIIDYLKISSFKIWALLAK